MRIPRIYSPLPLASGKRLVLEQDAAIHVGRVLRLKVGDPLILFDGRGGEYEASLASIGKRETAADVKAHRHVDTESPLRLTLIQAVSRGERMDFTLQKAVELGVTRIIPVISARSVVNLNGERRERRHDHWFKIIVGACEQSGRNRLPELLPLAPISTALSNPGEEELKLVLDPRATCAPDSLPRSSAITLLVGPEGGFDSAESMEAQKAGFVGLRLGPRVLRTETAALVALAVLQANWGDLK